MVVHKSKNGKIYFEMKNLCHIYIFLLFWSSNYAQSQQQFQQQTIKTYFVPTAEMLDLNKFTNVNQTITLTNTRFVFNIQFHGVLNTDGTSPSPLGETQAFDILARLNEVYNVHNIFFKYRGFNTVKNSNLTYLNFLNFNLMASAIKQQFVNENKYDENAINFYLYQGYSGMISGISPNDNTEVFLLNLPSFTAGGQQYPHLIPKLLGHALGLLNIDANSAGGFDTQITANCPLPTVTNTYNRLRAPEYNGYNSSIENVTRSGANYNATTAGDLIADTEACFFGFQQNFCNNITNGYSNYITWNFNSSIVDQVGTPYVCTPNEGNNFMSELCFSGPNGLFTNGQVTRMKEFIEGNMANIFRQKLNVFEDDSPDISVLYEPFISNMNNGNNSMYAAFRTFLTNSTQTGANVWNCGPFAMRFQTGFDCEFSSPTGNVTQSIYQQYNTSSSTYVGVKIPILGEQIYVNNAPVCFGSFEPFTSGDVKSLNNLGSSLYTQEQLDEIKASDPSLYEQLESGKYHIITKQTDSGFIDQKVIYKN